MSSQTDYSKYDLNHMIVKPLYFGLGFNILLPMILVFICYYIDNQNGWSALVGFDMANNLFYIFGLMAVLEAAAVLLWREKMMSQPMIKSTETFEHDLTSELFSRIKPISIIISGINLYGVAYYILTARIKETIFFVFFSFIVFQVVRPRLGFIKRLIDRQLEMVGQNQFKI